MLDALHLLRDRTQDAFLHVVELVKSSPRSDLTKTNKNAAHCLEVERLVAIEHEHKPTKLDIKCLDGFGFARHRRLETKAAI